ncbi:hypothetical protein ACUODF_49280, partial [Escherichia coli]
AIPKVVVFERDSSLLFVMDCLISLISILSFEYWSAAAEDKAKEDIMAEEANNTPKTPANVLNLM